MRKSLILLTNTTQALGSISSIQAANPVDTASIPSETQVNTICPISGKPANPAITLSYEGRTYAFADAACRDQFSKARQDSLYQKLGGKAALDAAVELFYKKVLADARVNHYFSDINMNKQRRKQKEFLSAALGGPIPWTGKDLRAAHQDLSLKESDFSAIAENLVATLQELKIDKALIDQVIALVATTHDAVLNHPQAAK
jgi:hemoglobin